MFRRRRRSQSDFSEELRAHLALETDRLREEGLSEEEASAMARRNLGNITKVEERYYESHRWIWLDYLWQDLRYGLRQLRRNPGFAAVAIVTLALGIGANSAIFSVVYGVLLSPLPYHQPGRLVVIYESTNAFNQSSVSYLNFLDWQRDSHSFQQMAAQNWEDIGYTGPGGPKYLEAQDVSANFFSLLGVRPILGRAFLSQEDQAGGAHSVVLSFHAWRNLFNGRPGALGKTVMLTGEAFTVVGVLPAGFRFRGGADVYLPIGQRDVIELNDRRSSPGINVVARLKPGVTLAQARADMNAVAQHLAEAYPEADKGVGAKIVPLKQDRLGDVGHTLFLLLGAVGFVLLVACANVASLLLARSASRKREFAVRSALGAGRMRVIRQLLTESVLLALGGSGLGLLVAKWGIRPILAAVPGSLPRSHNIRLNLPVLLFTFGVAIVVGLLFGLAPALQSSHVDLQGSLKEGGRTATGEHHRAQSVLVVSEIALTLVLLLAAGLMVQMLRRLWAVNPGFDPHRVVTMRVALSPAVVNHPRQIRLAFDNVLDRVSHIPGVQAAAFTSLVPLGANDNEIPFWTGNSSAPSVHQTPQAMFFGISQSSGYFRAMRIPLLRGRLFNSGDNLRSPQVVLIDTVLAHHTFPGQDPIGQRLNLPVLGAVRVVGVVGHVKFWSLASGRPNSLSNDLYFPIRQIPDRYMSEGLTGIYLVVRTRSSPLAMLSPIRGAVMGPGRDQPVYDVQTMEQVISASLAGRRFPTLLLEIFAGLALALAAVGIYGVISYSVSQRIHEVGIRMALGAQRSDILRLVVRQGIILALTGVGIGIAAGLGLTRLLTKLLYGVRPTDPLTFLAVSLILCAVALTACYIPARRATNVDPMAALRQE
jgi:predicted permease